MEVGLQTGYCLKMVNFFRIKIRSYLQHYFIIFWASEAVVLFWLYQQSRIKLIKIASVLVTVLMLISLLMDWSQIYFIDNKLVTIIANKGFTTSIVAACSLFIYFLLLKKE